jgi:hypothetical protein
MIITLSNVFCLVPSSMSYLYTHPYNLYTFILTQFLNHIHVGSDHKGISDAVLSYSIGIKLVGGQWASVVLIPNSSTKIEQCLITRSHCAG